MNAVIVFSGSTSSPDNLDTIVQVEEVTAILDRLGIVSQRLAFNESLGDLERSLRALQPHFIFNLVETAGGTDRLLYVAAACFEFLKIPYTGCPASALALLSSKLRQKELLRGAGLPTPDWTGNHPGHLMDGPLIVKSDSEHASVGLHDENVVTSASSARQILAKKQETHGGEWFAEAYIEGREFNLSVLEGRHGQPQVLPPAEIRFHGFPGNQPKIVGYEAKWDTGSFEYQATTRHFDFPAEDGPLLDQLGELSLRCWHLLGLKGAARIDFRVDRHGNPWILEVNANPCLASDAGFMAAARQSGLTPIAVIGRLLPRIPLGHFPCQPDQDFWKGTLPVAGGAGPAGKRTVPLRACH